MTDIYGSEVTIERNDQEEWIVRYWSLFHWTLRVRNLTPGTGGDSRIPHSGLWGREVDWRWSWIEFLSCPRQNHVQSSLPSYSVLPRAQAQTVIKVPDSSKVVKAGQDRQQRSDIRLYVRLDPIPYVWTTPAYKRNCLSFEASFGTNAKCILLCTGHQYWHVRLSAGVMTTDWIHACW